MLLLTSSPRAGTPPKHRPLVRENKNNVLDGVEGDVHRDEEQGPLEVLNALDILLSVPEQQNGEAGRERSCDQFDIGCLGQAE